METESFDTRCCVVGGGPAGVMLGYLLARAGVAVTILEKHKDFFRDFRGDTVHPSTLELLYELGLLDEFLRQPHQEITSVGVTFGDYTFQAANFEHLGTHCRFGAIMPQWDFLNFLSEQGRKHSSFDLRMEHEATDVISDGRRIRGVVVRTPEGTKHIYTDLVVACDGRHSMTRDAARMELDELGVPIDVLWFRISRHSSDRESVLGQINFGKLLVLINRQDYFQAGLIIRKDSFQQIRAKGLEAFRRDLAQIAPFLSDRVGELQEWDQVKLLSVQINRLKQWSRPGLLCIGDAAHAMSPVFGIGINLAIQDAVATANILTPTLRNGGDPNTLLPKVQRHRELRTRIVQRLQVIAHTGMEAIFRNPGEAHAPWQLKLVTRARLQQPLIRRIVGVGIVPEHVSAEFAPRRRGRSKIARVVGMGAAIAAVVAITCLGFSRCRPSRVF